MAIKEKKFEEGTDSRGNHYFEFEMLNEEKVRVTYVKKGWPGGPTVRFQIRQKNGQLRRGPDVPLENMGEVMQAVVELVRKQS